MKRVLCIVVGLAIAIPVVARQQSAAELFNRALLLERAEGRLDDALVLYERVVSEFPNDREVVPQALLHLSKVYERQRDPRSISLLVRLADGFPSTSYAAEARRRLTTLQTVEPFKAQLVDLDDAVLGPLGTGPVDFSPDGRLMAFAKAPTPGTTQRVWSLHLRELDGRRAERMLIEASPRRINSVNFSRNSRRLFVRVLTPNEIKVITLDGESSMITVPGRGDSPLASSPNEEWLAYVAPTENAQEDAGDFKLLNFATGESRSLGVRLGRLPDFRWSRDGATLVFWATRTEAAVQEVAVVTMATGMTRRVVVHRAEPNATQKTPWYGFQLGKLTTAGELVVWRTIPETNAQPYRRIGSLVPLNGGEIREICSHSIRGGCWDVSWDGKSVVVLDDATQRLFLRNTTNGVDQPINWSSAQEWRSAYRSPDDRLEVFVSNRDGAWGIYAALLDQGPAVTPVRLATVDGPPAQGTTIWWGTDTLVFRTNVEDSKAYRLSLDAATGRTTGPLEPIAADLDYAYRPVASPDGKRIAVFYRKGLRNGLALLDASGRFEKSLLETYAFIPTREVPRFEWRSNDEIISGDLRGTASSGQLVSINVVSERIAPLPNTVLATREWRYVPDGDELLFDAGEHTMLMLQSLTTGRTRTLVSLANVNQYIDDFQVGKRGTEVAYVVQALNGCMNTPCQLRVSSIDGTNDRVIATAATRGQSWSGIQAFSADGKLLISGGQLIHADTGERQLLLGPGQLPGNAAAVPVESGGFLPDGSAVLLSVRTVRHEIRRWEGFSAEAVAKALKR
jgi:Tol biopolymer transport system component